MFLRSEKITFGGENLDDIFAGKEIKSISTGGVHGDGCNFLGGGVSDFDLESFQARGINEAAKPFFEDEVGEESNSTGEGKGPHRSDGQYWGDRKDWGDGEGWSNGWDRGDG